MDKALQNYQIAGFALDGVFENIDGNTIQQLKRHLLDSLGSFIHSVNKPTIQKLVRQLSRLEQDGPCKAPGLRGLSYDRAAQFYTGLIRYPDFMDNYMGK